MRKPSSAAAKLGFEFVSINQFGVVIGNRLEPHCSMSVPGDNKSVRPDNSLQRVPCNKSVRGQNNMSEPVADNKFELGSFSRPSCRHKPEFLSQLCTAP